MRPTKLVADSKVGFLDAARQLIEKANTLSDSIKSIRIVEDFSAMPTEEHLFRLKAHVLKRS